MPSDLRGFAMPTVAYESGTGRFERRIGRRVDLELATIAWVDPPTLPGAPARREWPGRIVNVSVTGAAIDGPAELPVSVGDKAAIRYRGKDSGVTICRSEATNQPGVRRYGVEFVVLQKALKNEVYHAVSQGRPGEDSWQRAI